jgi:hypothetical protein
MSRLSALFKLLFWRPRAPPALAAEQPPSEPSQNAPRVIVSTLPPWEPNRPKKDGYNWIPVGNIPEPVWITLLYSRGGRDGRVLVKSARANREGVIYLDCDENGDLRRVRADYIRSFVDDDGHAIEPRDFLGNGLSIPLWERSIRAKAPPRGWGRGGLKS